MPEPPPAFGRGGTKNGTPNRVSPARLNSSEADESLRLRRRWSAMRYMIFCGAPAHLIGMAGWVNRAVPPRKLLICCQGYSAGAGRKLLSDTFPPTLFGRHSM